MDICRLVDVPTVTGVYVKGIAVTVSIKLLHEVSEQPLQVIMLVVVSADFAFCSRMTLAWY